MNKTLSGLLPVFVIAVNAACTSSGRNVPQPVPKPPAVAAAAQPRPAIVDTAINTMLPETVIQQALAAGQLRDQQAQASCIQAQAVIQELDLCGVKGFAATRLFSADGVTFCHIYKGRPGSGVSITSSFGVVTDNRSLVSATEAVLADGQNEAILRNNCPQIARR